MRRATRSIVAVIVLGYVGWSGEDLFQPRERIARGGPAIMFSGAMVVHPSTAPRSRRKAEPNRGADPYGAAPRRSPP